MNGQKTKAEGHRSRLNLELKVCMGVTGVTWGLIDHIICSHLVKDFTPPPHDGDR